MYAIYWTVNKLMITDVYQYCDPRKIIYEHLRVIIPMSQEQDDLIVKINVIREET